MGNSSCTLIRERSRTQEVEVPPRCPLGESWALHGRRGPSSGYVPSFVQINTTPQNPPPAVVLYLSGIDAGPV